MATKRLQGFLRDPLSEYAQHDLWRFTHLTTTGEVVKGSQSIRRIGADGSYDFLVRFGRVLIESKDRLSQRWVLHGEYTINSQTTATTIPALLLATTPTTPEIVQQLEALLNDAQDAANLAQQSAQEASDLAESFGTSASRDVVNSPTDVTSGKVATVGYGGIGRIISPIQQNYNAQLPSGMYVFSNIATPSPGPGTRTVFNLVGDGNAGGQIAFRAINNQVSVRSVNGESADPFVELYHTGNTTVDGNGFVKQASPIIKLYSDRIVKNGNFNAEFKRAGVGHYLISGTLGLSRSGWFIETPKDANGNIKVFIDYQDADGDITIKTYKPSYESGKAEAGEPSDIPSHRWIDIRLNEDAKINNESDGES